MKLLLLAGIGVAMALTAATPVEAATPATACHAPQGIDHAFYPVPMQRTAVDTEDDPAGIWSKGELSSLFKSATTLWQGAMPVCGGQVIVSQIVNRQCSSPTACPARVVFRDDKAQQVLLDYKQVCTLHPAFELRGDIAELRACDEAFKLDPVRSK